LITRGPATIRSAKQAKLLFGHRPKEQATEYLDLVVHAFPSSSITSLPTFSNMAAIRNSLRLGMIPADGIGKEVIPAAEAVLLALGSDIPKPSFVPLLAGWEVFCKTGNALPQETIDVLKNECDGAMFGSVR
jgi:hypothetical protein